MSAPTQAQGFDRARELFEDHLASVYRRRDRVFASLMAIQWIFAILIAVLYSPLAWVGKVQTTHVHVYYAVFLGGLISGPTILLTLYRPGWVVTRHTVAVAQMLWSALLIHLTGGRIETHFHIFGSLAFLAFYRDWKVVLTATLAAAAEHLLRGLTWPESVYGIANPEWWRFLEHAFWMVFEDGVLVMGILENLKEMKALASRQAEMEALNSTIEEKVVQRTEELAASREQFRSLVETTRSVPWQWDLTEGRFTYAGPQGAEMLGCSVEDWLVPGFWEDRVHPDDRPMVQARWSIARVTGTERDFEFRMRRNDGGYVTIRSIVSDLRTDGCSRGFMLDITEQRRLEFELNQAQRLESVGRLASGIAHEINTPIQFVSDNIHFIRGAFATSLDLIEKYKALRIAALEGAVLAEMLTDLSAAERKAKLPFITENVPDALEASIEGLERVATLVRSMKEFAHPDQTEKSNADLNRALSTTLTVARAEYKYVAHVETDFGELPQVVCHVSELNQAFLNIIVNASHAIAAMVEGKGTMGLIRVTTRHEDDRVIVTIADTGGGIPDSIRAKVFDAFFTTKEVGQGTGQGLSIARSVVVGKHGGTLTFESETGVGTTFTIGLPIGASRAAAA